MGEQTFADLALLLASTVRQSEDCLVLRLFIVLAESGGFFVHPLQGFLHGLMVLIEVLALLVEWVFTIPMLKTQVIAVVEFADSVFPVRPARSSAQGSSAL